jgi:hypothetical protein
MCKYAVWAKGMALNGKVEGSYHKRYVRRDSRLCEEITH